jgi:hypothetical protein
MFRKRQWKSGQDFGTSKCKHPSYIIEATLSNMQICPDRSDWEAIENLSRLLKKSPENT